MADCRRRCWCLSLPFFVGAARHRPAGSQGIGVFNIVLTRSLILVLFTGPELFYHRVNPFHDRRWASGPGSSPAAAAPARSPLPTHGLRSYPGTTRFVGTVGIL